MPRLIAAGADLTKVGRLAIDTYIDGDTQEVTPRVPMDTTTMADVIREVGAVAVLIDPIASTMNGDLNREADVRAAVGRALARVAEATDSVVMFVRHFGKGGGQASDKMSGSHAFRDAVAVGVLCSAADEDRVIVTQDKGNYAPPGDESFAFRLENVRVNTEDGPTEVARVIDLRIVHDTSVGDIIKPHLRNRPARRYRGVAHRSVGKRRPVKANEVYQAAPRRPATPSTRPSGRRNGWASSPSAQSTPDRGSRRLPPTTNQGAQSRKRRAPRTHLEACSLLPVRSEGVEQRAEGGREQSAEECSLGPPTPAAMPSTKPVQAAPAATTHHRRATHTQLPAISDEQLVYADDRHVRIPHQQRPPA
ncbi:MAG: AAA family ATPase [Mycobacterium sp.]|nr:AAA family ATPase [Mycobacterium sp.]